jgi:hypothetical protein
MLNGKEEVAMALFEGALEDLAEGGAATGVALGVGALLLVPGLLPAVGNVMRSLAVGAIKTGIMVYDQTAAAVRETTGDLVAEARAQMESDRQNERRETPAPTHTRREAHA